MKLVVPELQLKSRKALEMTMRDALEGLHEAASRFGFHPGIDDMQILSIEAVTETDENEALAPASVHQLEIQTRPHEETAPGRSSDILQYLFERETRLAMVPS